VRILKRFVSRAKRAPIASWAGLFYRGFGVRNCDIKHKGCGGLTLPRLFTEQGVAMAPLELRSSNDGEQDVREEIIMAVATRAIQIRPLKDEDPPVISAAFADIGWRKPISQYERYLSEQAVGHRTCLVATAGDLFAAYVTVNWSPDYAAFAELNIPEIQDLNVIPAFRRLGIATQLLDSAEAKIAVRADVAGVGVGLHPGYNAAQKLYVKRGYVPDGRGLTYRNEFVQEGMSVVLDDELVLHLTKYVGPAARDPRDA
jgi:GNAT superfamily N-acetyltransferase